MEYNLTFTEALRLVMEEYVYVKGEHFKDGYFLKKDHGRLEVVNANNFYDSWPCVITSELMNQKFRSFTVANKKDLRG